MPATGFATQDKDWKFMLTDRQQKIVDFFFENSLQSVGVNSLPKFNVDRTTIFRDLKAIVDTRIFTSKLTTKGLLYSIDKQSNAFIEWDLSRPPASRKTVKYNPSLLGEYIPNKSFLLSECQLNNMDEAGSACATYSKVESTKNYGRILSSLLIDLTHASSNLERVKISWLDTKALIEFGEAPNSLTDKDFKIVLNHKNAIDYMASNRGDLLFSSRSLMDIHALLTDGLLGDSSAIGALRKRVVKFDDSKYLPPDNPYQLRDIFAEFCDKAAAIKNPYEQAFFAMTFIPYIQPFEDGNKRTSRICMNIPLISNELPPFSFADVKERDYMLGLLAFYERGTHKFLADSFVDAYVKSASRYTELMDFVGEGGFLSSLTEDKYFSKSPTYTGKIIDVDVSDDVVIQKIDREGATMRHSLSKLTVNVQVGQVVDIKYEDGIGIVSGRGIGLDSSDVERYFDLPQQAAQVVQLSDDGLEDAVNKSLAAAFEVGMQKGSCSVVDTALDKTHSGKVVGVTGHHVVLSLGRSALVVGKADIDRVPAVGEDVDLKFSGGKGVFAPVKAVGVER